MNILYKLSIFLLLSATLNATTLKEIIQILIKNSPNIKSLNYSVDSKKKNYESVSNTFNPTVNTGATYNKLNIDVPSNKVGTTTVGYIRFGANLYDGGRNSAIKRQKKYELIASKYSKDNNIKQMILQAVTLFYQIKEIEATIKAYKDKATALYEQYKTEKEKYDIKMVTIDEVLKFKSEYESSRYVITDLKYQKESLLENLSVLTGKKITFLNDSKLLNIKNLTYSPSPAVKSMQAQLNGIQEDINVVKSFKKPKINIEDTLSIYGYDDYNKNILKDLPDTQNQFMLSFSINLYDTTTKAKKESVIYAKLSKKQEINYIISKEKSAFRVAKKKLSAQKEKIKSAKSAYKSAKSVYKIIFTKYQNSVVDNIAYLDALSQLTLSYAQYKQALYDYEIAKANYYFASGFDMKKIIR